MTAPTWLDRVRAATAGPELLDFLTKRLTRPYEEGPPVDDRRGEGAEEVFERLAKESEDFRARVEVTIADYFSGPLADPTDPVPVVTRGLLDIAQSLALAGTFSWIRAWLQRYERVLRSNAPGLALGGAALGALTTSQVPGLADGRDFWLGWWRHAPPEWQPRAFIGLRLHDPRTAAEEIPELLRRAERQRPGPGPLLLGMWKQPEGRTALLAWLRATKDDEMADRVRQALRRLIPAEDQEALGT
jgi:hypothetical protein